MKAKIKSIKLFKSRWGGDCYLVKFRDIRNKEYISYIYPKKKNFTRWKKVLKEGIVLDNLTMLKGKKKYINADCNFKEVKNG